MSDASSNSGPWWRRHRKLTGARSPQARDSFGRHDTQRLSETPGSPPSISVPQNLSREPAELPASPNEVPVPELDSGPVYELPSKRDTLNAEVLELEAPGPKVVFELPTREPTLSRDVAEKPDEKSSGGRFSKSPAREDAWNQKASELPIRRHTLNEDAELPGRRDTLTMLQGHDKVEDARRNLSPSSAASSERLRAYSHPAYEGLQIAGSSSTSSNDKDSQTSSRGFRSVLSLKSRSPSLRPGTTRCSKALYPPYFLDNACFSAAGSTLYLWKPKETKVAVLSVPSPGDPNQYPVTLRLCNRAHFVAGGTHKYIVASLQGAEEAEVEVYWNNMEEQPPESTSFVLPLNSSKNSFAVSRDDESLAMTSRNSVSVWDLRTGSIRRRIPMPIREIVPRSEIPVTIDSQRTAFSADSESITVATRFSNGHVFIHAWNIEEGESSIHSASVNMPSGRLHDLGLTSVFCDNDLRAAIVTAMVNNVDRVIYPFNESHRFSWPSVPLRQQHFSYQITNAAQSPSGRTYAIATSSNQIFTLSLARAGVEVVKVEDLSKELVNCVRLKDSIVLGCPDDETVFAFCFDKDRVNMFFAIATKDGSSRYQIRERFS